MFARMLEYLPNTSSHFCSEYFLDLMASGPEHAALDEEQLSSILDAPCASVKFGEF